VLGVTQPLADIVDALYGGDPKHFVAARDAAAREMRAAGRRDEAKAVKALTRPTVAAAGVNRTVRSGAVAGEGAKRPREAPRSRSRACRTLSRRGRGRPRRARARRGREQRRRRSRRDDRGG